MTVPFVTIVTPFYNTAPYLRACIESVLAQTHAAWDYVLVDNASTDGSSEIAAEYAARDPRVRLVRNPRHLPQLENYNVAWGLISDRAAYCKMVQADDWVFPECVARMVDVAERHPRVGLVSAYYLKGAEVLGTGLPVDQECFPGSAIARAQLMEGRFYLGSCTSVLYRASLVRAEAAFYDPAALHADTEAGYRILARWDFGFVHQVLTFLRLDDESISGRVRDWNPHVLDKLIVLKQFGSTFLSPTEYTATLAAVSRRYWRDLGRRALRPRGAEFWAYHKRGLARADEPFTTGRLARGALGALVDLVLHPRETLEELRQLAAR